MKRTAALFVLAILAPALASAPVPSSAAEPPALVETPAVPDASPAPRPAPPALLTGVTATLTIPRTVSGKLPVTLTLQSSRAATLPLEVPRNNDQDCATAPLLRVLRVGTREVVYPALGQPVLCAQDVQTSTLAARGKVSYNREIKLPAGEYMVEGWWQGFAGGERAKVPAQPLRVTVK